MPFKDFQIHCAYCGKLISFMSRYFCSLAHAPVCNEQCCNALEKQYCKMICAKA